MKILSNFKDYYDIQLKYDQDRNIVYKRFTSDPVELPEHKPIRLSVERVGRPYKSASVDAGAIYFCGTMYPFLDFSYYKQTVDEKHDNYCSCCSDDHIQKTLYDMESVDKLIETLYEKEPRILKNYWEKGPERQVREFLSRRKDFEKVFTPGRCDVLLQHIADAPIAALDERYDVTRVIRNPNLNDYDFVRVMHGVIAFQELERWMTNIAIPIEPIPDIDDKSMAASKGYDKYSFRKGPTKYPRRDR